MLSLSFRLFPTKPILPRMRPSLQQLNAQYQRLIGQAGTPQTIGQIEKAKLAIMRQVYKELIRHPFKEAHLIPRRPKASAWGVLKQRLAYYSLLVIGFLMDMGNAYCFGISLLSALMPAFPEATLILFSIIYAGLDALLFLCFDACHLRENLGLNASYVQMRQLVSVYKQQIILMSRMNSDMSSIFSLHLSNKDYDEFIRFAEMATRDLRIKHRQLPQQDSDLWMRLMQPVLFAFGAVSSVAGTYFMVTSMMVVFLPTWVGTLAGALLTGFMATAGVFLHYVTGESGMDRVINRQEDSFNQLREQWDYFVLTYSDNLQALRLVRQHYQDKVVHDMSTQYDLNDLNREPTAIALGLAN